MLIPRSSYDSYSIAQHPKVSRATKASIKTKYIIKQIIETYINFQQPQHTTINQKGSSPDSGTCVLTMKKFS